jgi:hypothetical protein
MVLTPEITQYVVSVLATAGIDASSRAANEHSRWQGVAYKYDDMRERCHEAEDQLANTKARLADLEGLYRRLLAADEAKAKELEAANQRIAELTASCVSPGPPEAHLPKANTVPWIEREPKLDTGLQETIHPAPSLDSIIESIPPVGASLMPVIPDGYELLPEGLLVPNGAKFWPSRLLTEKPNWRDSTFIGKPRNPALTYIRPKANPAHRK